MPVDPCLITSAVPTATCSRGSNLQTKLPAYQTALGLTADQVKAVQDQCDALAAALNRKTGKKTEYDATVAAAGQAAKTILGGLRPLLVSVTPGCP